MCLRGAGGGARRRPRADMPAKDLDAVARARIAEAGYGEHFGHGLGHGVGLVIHERPGVRPEGTEILRAGMAITIEPGIYLEGEGGVRIEDLVVLGEDGFERLSHTPKELRIVGVRASGGHRPRMITTNDLKNGYVLDIDGELVSVVSFQHVKPGKGGAFVRTKLKSMTSGAVVEKTFRAGREGGAGHHREPDDAVPLPGRRRPVPDGQQHLRADPGRRVAGGERRPAGAQHRRPGAVRARQPDPRGAADVRRAGRGRAPTRA